MDIVLISSMVPLLKLYFIIRGDSGVESGHVGLSKVQRAWAQLALEDEVRAEQFTPNVTKFAEGMTFQVDFMRKGSDQSAVFDSSKMAEYFHRHFDDQVFTIGQVTTTHCSIFILF